MYSVFKINFPKFFVNGLKSLKMFQKFMVDMLKGNYQVA